MTVHPFPFPPLPPDEPASTSPHCVMIRRSWVHAVSPDATVVAPSVSRGATVVAPCVAGSAEQLGRAA